MFYLSFVLHIMIAGVIQTESDWSEDEKWESQGRGDDWHDEECDNL